MPYYSVSIDGQDMNGTLSGDSLGFDEMPGVSVSFPGEEGIPEYRCTECEETTHSDADDANNGRCSMADDGVHVWQAEAHAWVNSARISADDDTVAVHISVGDPRGAFTMSVTRGDDGELRLSVPTPSDAMAHLGLVPLASDGYYRIVASESAEHVAAREAMRRTADVENALQRASRDFARAGSGSTPAERNEARALILASLLDRLGIATPAAETGE